MTRILARMSNQFVQILSFASFGCLPRSQSRGNVKIIDKNKLKYDTDAFFALLSVSLDVTNRKTRNIGIILCV